MVNPPYAVFSSDKIFFKTLCDFPKGKALEDTNAEKLSRDFVGGRK